MNHGQISSPCLLLLKKKRIVEYKFRRGLGWQDKVTTAMSIKYKIA